MKSQTTGRVVAARPISRPGATGADPAGHPCAVGKSRRSSRAFAGRAGFLAGLILALLAGGGCAPKKNDAGPLKPRTEEEAEAAVRARFDVSRYQTNEFIPDPGSPPPSPLVPRRTLRVGLNWVANDQAAPWLLGRELGFFADAGIDLKIVEGGPGRDHLNTLVAGNIDVYIGFPEPLFQMIASPTGSALMMICSNLQNSPIAWITLDAATPRDRRSTRKIGPEDLRGRRIGVQPGGTYYIAYALGRVGLTLDDVKLVNAGAGPDALIGGAMDFYQGWIDNQPRMMERNGYFNWTAFAFSDVGYPAYGEISTVTPAFYAREKEVLHRYVFALDRSLRHLIAHPEASARIVAGTAEVTSHQLGEADVRWRLGRDIPLFKGDGTQPLMAMDLGRLRAIAVQMYRYRFLELPSAQKP